MVQTIALMHPFYGGEAVYWSRGAIKSYREDPVSSARKSNQQATEEIETELGNTFSLFPNPVNNALIVQQKSKQVEKVFISVFDLAGKLLFSFEKKEDVRAFTINTGNLSNGSYYLKIESNGMNSFYAKFVVVH
ncbi:MAG: Secretion system C-terminal sorting domain [Bacteroidota bacterium]|jgi:hypothetical protein